MKTMLSIAIGLVIAAPAFADDDERHERRGPKTKYENNAEHYRYEYKDRRCKYEYKYSYRTGKTKVEQKGDCRHVAMVRPVAYEPLPRAIPPAPEVRVVECNRDVLGAILGGAIGAAVGSRIGDRDDRVITTVGGAVIGAVVGGAIGRSMDDADQACAAQSLEYGHGRQTVAWKSARGAHYTMTPTGSDRNCRNYVLKTSEGGRPVEQAGRACRRKDGAWVFVS
jgi:surface antigen